MMSQHLSLTISNFRLYNFFQFSFTNELIEFNSEQSNLKAIRANVNKPTNISTAKIEQFIGIMIFNGLVHLPAMKLYWSNSPALSK